MGHIISHMESINRVRFTKLRSGRPANVKRALDLGNGGVLLELENGSYSVVGPRQANAINGNWAVLGYGNTTPTKAVLYGLAKMGVVRHGDVRAHVQRAKERARASEVKYAKESLERACKTLGIEVPEVTA